jgi:hypothetical protein
LETFGDFIPKGEKLEPKQAMHEHRKEKIKKGGGWMMVSIQVSVSGLKYHFFAKFCLP